MDQVHQIEPPAPRTPTPRFERTIARATQLAQEMGHPGVGTEHLLLALLEDIDGIAAQVLNREHRGELIRQEIETIMADPRYLTPSRRAFLRVGGRLFESHPSLERGDG